MNQLKMVRHFETEISFKFLSRKKNNLFNPYPAGTESN